MDRRAARRRSRWVTVGSILVLLVLWEAVARIIGSQIIVPTPAATFIKLVRLLATPSFWTSVAATVSRGVLGFVISLAAGVLVGVAAGASSLIRSGVSPVLTVLRATPVMSVILLALIWFRTDWVPVFVAFLMVFPILCGNVMEGVRNVDVGLLRMAGVYEIPRKRVIAEIYLPSAVPYLIAAMRSAVGITWKVVVAAEVLSQPLHAVGTGLQLSKYRLDTAGVFAWTFVAIALTALSERALEWIERRIPWHRSGNGN